MRQSQRAGICRRNNSRIPLDARSRRVRPSPLALPGRLFGRRQTTGWRRRLMRGRHKTLHRWRGFYRGRSSKGCLRYDILRVEMGIWRRGPRRPLDSGRCSCEDAQTPIACPVAVGTAIFHIPIQYDTVRKLQSPVAQAACALRRCHLPANVDGQGNISRCAGGLSGVEGNQSTIRESAPGDGVSKGDLIDNGRATHGVA